jgi:molybdopterin-guanine dinucleotide biosynthesis protein A
LNQQDITGLVLAGGRGSRMGGVDKGLQNFRGLPLALHTLMRLQMQVGATMINANRNLAAYESFGAPVWPDALADYAGPLAGFLTGLEHCETPWLLTVPCDTPAVSAGPGQRLATAADQAGADIAMAAAPEDDGAGGTAVRPSPCSACCAWTCSKAWSPSPRRAAARLTPGPPSTSRWWCRLTSRATTRWRFQRQHAGRAAPP